MLQTLESYFFISSVIFIFFGLFAFGWLVIHIERGRHFSKLKAILAIILGSVLMGFGLHFLLLAMAL